MGVLEHGIIRYNCNIQNECRLSRMMENQVRPTQTGLRWNCRLPDARPAGMTAAVCTRETILLCLEILEAWVRGQTCNRWPSVSGRRQASHETLMCGRPTSGRSGCWVEKVPTNLQGADVIGATQQTCSSGNPVMLRRNSITLFQAPVINRRMKLLSQGSPEALPTVELYAPETSRSTLPSR